MSINANITARAGLTADITIGARGPQGIQGPEGPQGPQGPVGPQGANGDGTITQQSFTFTETSPAVQLNPNLLYVISPSDVWSSHVYLYFENAQSGLANYYTAQISTGFTGSLYLYDRNTGTQIKKISGTETADDNGFIQLDSSKQYEVSVLNGLAMVVGW